MSDQASLSSLYNLILTSGTRDFERQQLVVAKNAIEQGQSAKQALANLEVTLRPLAVRNNLSPDVTDFYQQLVEPTRPVATFDLSAHQADDLPYQQRAIFAGGCFWCMVSPFDQRPGIISVVSGYTGGHVNHPTYEQVMSQTTGHVEAVEIIFDTRQITYAQLVDIYWQLIDPTDAEGQVNDRGISYRPIIFVQNDQQRAIAEASKQRVIDSGRYHHPIVVEIQPAQTFWPAENFHQDFYRKQPQRYRAIERERKRFLAFQRLQNKTYRLTHRV
ncbi:peptide-methionine (S)-S-oxide reductase MsrA [Furfurilactobacillus curtus]|uniref:Peptide methionine sulfoxide reductase MsrA n=1 Tax=Furfurilactobacillus curtus TaxID=1746200 RepID=A0ABQ5JRU5_9LACO